MYWNDAGWAWMMFMPLFWIALIGAVVWATIRLTRRPSERPGDGTRPNETPRDILDRRYASGEIDTEAYTEARAHLADRSPGP
ncbi:SHOCT domain-containing protein [Kitasatospora sp. NPDC085879]|uniref:SHOCT domain-containing protein n=1 Tax=Kitasatospora sp. NPDC085879 TaxID=3154769 RepID=UPI003436E201